MTARLITVGELDCLQKGDFIFVDDLYDPQAVKPVLFAQIIDITDASQLIVQPHETDAERAPTGKLRVLDFNRLPVPPKDGHRLSIRIETTPEPSSPE